MALDSPTMNADDAHIHSIALFVALLSACIVIGHLLEKYRWVNGSITALAIGLCTAVIIRLTTGKSLHILIFREDIFFMYLLPPIIFNAGFQVRKKHFFRNFITINLFGAVGTLICFGIISIGSMQLLKRFNLESLDVRDYLALGAILSATDSVCTLQVLNQDETPLLYSLVFGEGVVNDATSVVLFNAIQRFDLSHITSNTIMQCFGSFFYLFILSTFLGMAVGLMSAYVIRKLYLGRHSTDQEVALMTLLAYLSYIMADLFQLSGILTVFFCGIVMSHYTWHNVTESSRVTTKHTFATLSFLSEIFIFIYVGIDALDMTRWKLVEKSPGTLVAVSSILLGLVLIGRAASIFPLSILSNLTKRNDKLRFKQQITIWWAGLMRGAVSVTLAYNKFSTKENTHSLGNSLLISSTITIVLFSNVVFGLLTKPLVRLMLPPRVESSNVMSSDLPILMSSTAPWLQNGHGLNSNSNSESGGIDMFSPLLSNGHDLESESEGHHWGGRNMARRSLAMLLTPTSTVHFYWQKFDNAVMRPIFGGGESTPNAFPPSNTNIVQ